MSRLRKKTLLLVLTLLFVLSAVLCGCDALGLTRQPHTHTYSTSWKYDSTNHWAECTKCGKTAQKANHTMGSWSVTVQPTSTTFGEKSRKCQVCNYTETQQIAKLAHQHELVEDISYNENGHSGLCSCGEFLTNQPHTFGALVVDSLPSATADGSQHKTCSVCGYEVIEVLHNYHYEITATGHKQSCTNCSSQQSTEQPHTASAWQVVTPATATSTGVKQKVCTVCGYVMETGTIDKIAQTRTVSFYAINDFHGAVEKISRIGGYLKDVTDGNTVILNSGDMFQGSMESNSNFGQLLSDCMSEIGFDAFCYGNHEFDWGIENLQTLASNSGTPFLGANIYHWDSTTKQFGTYASELAQEYVVKTLDNGLKVGIIGVIGQDQITSICSNLVSNIGFKDPVPIIKTLSTKLRTQENCDVVVVSAHCGADGLVGTSNCTYSSNRMTGVTSANGLEDYVDLVFCAHTHQNEKFEADGLTFIQGGCNGYYLTNVELQVTSNGTVSVVSKDNIGYSTLWTEDATIKNLVDTSYATIADEADEVLANFTYSFGEANHLPRLVARAMASYAQQFIDANNLKYNGQKIKLTCAITNNARSSISKGTVTYRDLYEAVPFDNTVYIARVTGQQLLNEVGYSSTYMWRTSGDAVENSSSKYYFIAVIDYMLYHQNTSRDFNYFSSAFYKSNDFEPVPLTKDGYLIYNYRFILRDYLRTHTVTGNSDYTSTNTNTDGSMLGQSVTLKYATASNGTSQQNYWQALLPSQITSAEEKRYCFA